MTIPQEKEDQDLLRALATENVALGCPFSFGRVRPKARAQ